MVLVGELGIYFNLGGGNVCLLMSNHSAILLRLVVLYRYFCVSVIIQKERGGGERRGWEWRRGIKKPKE